MIVKSLFVRISVNYFEISVLVFLSIRSDKYDNRRNSQLSTESSTIEIA